jgi:hypothetical protein
VKSYYAQMTGMIGEFKTDKHDLKNRTRMEYARMAAWTDGEEQARQLRRELGLE